MSVDPFHLFRYVDEREFRFNNPNKSEDVRTTDSERFHYTCRKIVSSGSQWNWLTGKTDQAKVSVGAQASGARKRSS